MPEEHPHLSREILQRYLRAELSHRDMHEVVGHLLDCCPQSLELALTIGQTEGFRLVEGELQGGLLQEGADENETAGTRWGEPAANGWLL